MTYTPRNSIELDGHTIWKSEDPRPAQESAEMWAQFARRRVLEVDLWHQAQAVDCQISAARWAREARNRYAILYGYELEGVRS